MIPETIYLVTVLVAMSVISFVLNSSALEISLDSTEQSTTLNADEQFLDMFPITKENFSSNVINCKDPWIVVFHDGSLTSSWTKSAVSSRGVVWFGLINKKEQTDMLYDMGIYLTKIPTARVYPAGGSAIKTKGWTDVSSPTKAKQVAIRSIPDETFTVNNRNIQTFILNSHTSQPSRFPVLYITTEEETPGFIKALAVHFHKYYKFGVMINPTSHDLQMLGADSSFLDLPSLMTLLTLEDKTKKTVHIKAIPFKTKTMGHLSYPNIVRYLFSVNQQYRHLLPGNNMSNQKQEAEMEDVAQVVSKRFDMSKSFVNSDIKHNQREEL